MNLTGEIQLAWHEPSGQLVFSGIKEGIFLFNPWARADEQQISPLVQDSYYGPFSLSPVDDRIAYGVTHSNRPTIRLLDFSLSNSVEQLPTLVGIALPQWHPQGGYLIAGDYSDDKPGSNRLVLLELGNDGARPTDSIKLQYPLSHVLGWSDDGDLVAVVEQTPVGLRLYYLEVSKGKVQESRYEPSSRSCVLDANWQPDRRELVFSAENSETSGFDLFLEKVPARGFSNGTFNNLTQSPGVEELAPAWAPDGSRIAYVKSYLDNNSEPVQDLFVIALENGQVTSRQVTATAQDFETSPTWIDNDLLAYASWSATDSTWSIKTVNLIAGAPK